MQNFDENLESYPISIACGADDNYAIGLAVTLYSALANLDANRAVDIYIIDGGISDQTQLRLTKILSGNSHVTVNLKWLKPELESLSGVKIPHSFSVAAYFRLLLPELLPTQIDRVIYLDSDLVVEGNLATLWERELDDSPAFAVQDYSTPYISNGLYDTYQELGLAPNTPYCNSGVMLINLKQWRAEDLSNKVLEYTRKYHDVVRLADQDGLNAIIADRWKTLDLKWNVQTFGVDFLTISLPCKAKDLIRDAFILHFTSSTKPWHPHFRRAGGERFAHYLEKSNWFDKIQYMKWLARVRLPQVLIYSLARSKRWITGKP
jgi:lipopolysaccharide biosynthesis glycosyltransferase